MCSVRYGLSVLSASILTVPPSCSNRCSALRHRHQRVERQEVRNKVIVFNKLTLLITDVLGNDSLATEAHPLNELVERLTFVGGGLNYLAHSRLNMYCSKKMVRTTRPSSRNAK